LIIFEKHPAPLTVEDKYQLKIIGSFCINEEVKSAAFGTLRLAQKPETQPKLDPKKLHYLK
jgi:hypothetical protein